MTVTSEFTIPEGKVTLYPEVEQHSDEWLELRRGMLTASTIGQLITPKTLKVAANADSRAIVARLVAERITGWVEPTFTTVAMWRGRDDEVRARDLYSKTWAEVKQLGFMTLTFEGHRLGYSPDGLVGTPGLIEVKSHEPKIHLAIILADAVPADDMAQVQCGLYVSGREWCDYISYCGGMPMWRKRVTPDPAWRAAIFEAWMVFEAEAAIMASKYREAVKGLPMTERVVYSDEIKVN